MGESWEDRAKRVSQRKAQELDEKLKRRGKAKAKRGRRRKRKGKKRDALPNIAAVPFKPWVRPEHKGQATKGARLKGKITLKQYLYLVEHFGVDGDKIKGWTCERASKEIARLQAREDRAIEQSHAQLDHELDRAIISA